MRQSPKQQSADLGSPTTRERADALRARLPEIAADPILAVIEESKRLMPAVRRARRMPDIRDRRPIEQDVADDALILHLHRTVLRTAPTTAAGAIELARHLLVYERIQGGTLEEKHLWKVIKLIAAAPTA